VRTVEPTGFTKISALGVEEQRVRIIADITTSVETWIRLGDGYRVEADFILWQGEDVLQIPASALFRHGDGWAVFRIDGSRARLHPVEVGHNNGFAAEIVKGLDVDDRVIVHPSDVIKDGVRIAPR
jgi:HlyD family secretion protein